MIYLVKFVSMIIASCYFLIVGALDFEEDFHCNPINVNSVEAYVDPIVPMEHVARVCTDPE